MVASDLYEMGEICFAKLTSVKLLLIAAKRVQTNSRCSSAFVSQNIKMTQNSDKTTLSNILIVNFRGLG